MASLYSHPKGRIRLRQAIAASYGKELNRELDPETEILVSAGANEGNQHIHITNHEFCLMSCLYNRYVCYLCWFLG